MTRHDKRRQVGMDRASRYLETLSEGWWSATVRPAVARAAYAEVAMAAGGIWEPSKIERLVASLAGRPPHLEGRSNKFRKILKDHNIPAAATVAEVRRALPTCDMQRWLDHPLFYLLDDRSSHRADFCRAACLYAFDSLAGPVRFLLWNRDVDDQPWTGVVPRILDERSVAQLMRSPEADGLSALDRLILSGALARLAALDNFGAVRAQVTDVIFASFGEAFARQCHLLVGSTWLLPILQSQFWAPSGPGGWPPYSYDDYLRNLSRAVDVARRCGEMLPPPDMYPEQALREAVT